MGGGGGTGRSIGDIDALLKRAKQELREETTTGKRNVFISFAYEDVGTVNLLRGQAKNENVPIVFNDWSVSEPIDSERATYIKQKISERIAQCSVTVVFLSDATVDSSWVTWEVEQSLTLGKKVIGVFPQNSRPQSMPAVFAKHGIKSVSWPELAKALETLG